MQIKVKSVKVLKTGTNDHGEWKLVGVTTDDGVKFSTFAKDADSIQPGVSINISDMDENEKGKSFKKFEIVEGTAKPEPAKITPAQPPSPQGPLPFLVEMDGRFRNTALMQACAIGKDDTIEEVLTVADKFYAWLKGESKPSVKALEKLVDREVHPPAQQEASLKGTEGLSTIVAEVVMLLDDVNWKPMTWRSWIKAQFKVDVTGELSEVIARLDPNQVNMFTNHLKGMKEASGVK